MVTIAFTVASSETAIAAAKNPATFGPKRCEAASAPTARTPFIFSSGTA